jgi:hypothetical protein
MNGIHLNLNAFFFDSSSFTFYFTSMIHISQMTTKQRGVKEPAVADRKAAQLHIA